MEYKATFWIKRIHAVAVLQLLGAGLIPSAKVVGNAAKRMHAAKKATMAQITFPLANSKKAEKIINGTATAVHLIYRLIVENFVIGRGLFSGCLTGDVEDLRLTLVQRLQKTISLRDHEFEKDGWATRCHRSLLLGLDEIQATGC